MFNHNLSAKVFDEVYHSGVAHLYSRPLRNKVNTVLYAQKDVNAQRWTEQSWKAPVNVAVPAAKPP